MWVRHRVKKSGIYVRDCEEGKPGEKDKNRILLNPILPGMDKNRGTYKETEGSARESWVELERLWKKQRNRMVRKNKMIKIVKFYDKTS